MAVTLTAAQVPIPQKFSGFLRLLDGQDDTGNAVVALNIAKGETTTVPAKYNRNVTSLDLTGRYGGGSYGVAHGLTLTSPSGLTYNVAAGHAIIDGVKEQAAAYTAGVLGDDIRNHIWFKRDGTFEVKTDLTAPATPAVYLGSILTASGVISGSIETAGVCYLQNGMMIRETADAGVPGDTPSSGMVYLTKTAGGLFLWDGTKYRYLSDQYGRAAIAMADANHTVSAADQQREILELTGAITGARNVVLTLKDGAKFIVANKTTGGFDLTFKSSTGTGVAVAMDKRAIIYCDGTNWVRVTPDT